MDSAKVLRVSDAEDYALLPDFELLCPLKNVRWHFKIKVPNEFDRFVAFVSSVSHGTKKDETSGSPLRCFFGLLEKEKRDFLSRDKISALCHGLGYPALAFPMEA